MQIDMSEAPLALPRLPKVMLSWAALPDGRMKYRINFSSLTTMQTCWKKTELSLVRCLKPLLEPPATLFGTAIHKGLEVFYGAPRTDRALPPKYKDVMRAIGCGQWEPDYERWLVFRAARAFVLAAAPLKSLPDTDKHSLACGSWMLTHYFERYLTDEYVIFSDAAGPVTERKFTLPVYEDEKFVIEGHGQIDAILRSEVTGKVLPCDHKTTGRLYSFYDSVKPNHQYTFYLWAARELFGLDTWEFLVNALEKKLPPKTARGSAPDFARQITDRTQSDIDELRLTICHVVGEFDSLRKNGYWPLAAPGPCGNYGGCTFREVCASPNEQIRETVIKSRFEAVPYVQA